MPNVLVDIGLVALLVALSAVDGVALNIAFGWFAVPLIVINAAALGLAAPGVRRMLFAWAAR